jgi:protein TonB
MSRTTLRPLLPATASVLIHLGIAALLLAAALESAGVPVLMAELVVAEPPPAVEARRPPPMPARDPRPITPPKLIAAAPPRPAPPRTEPEPPKPPAPAPPPATTPAPPAVAAPDPETPRAPSESVPAPTPAPAAVPGPAPGPSVTAAPDTEATTFTLPAPAPSSPAVPTSRPSAESPVAAALPPDGVTQGAIPRGRYQYRPAYPPGPRNLGIQGTTMLLVLVASDGRVAKVEIKQSAGHADLDRAAVEAVHRWRFDPARRGSEPVEMWVQLPFEFRLR